MQESQQPEILRCVCGRNRADAYSHEYRAQSGHFFYRRCTCGMEWTERQIDADRGQPVSSDEVLEVHERLAAFEGSFSDLLGRQSV
jgi:hypothetical protein